MPTIMSSAIDKLAGSARVAVGRIKRAYGEATGDRRAQSDGVIDEAAGRFRIAKGRAKAEMKKVIDEL